MALFGNYMKEGPGVDKNEKKKRGIFLYSDVVTRKFFQLMKLNILYVIFSLPFLAIAMFLFAPYICDAVGLSSLFSNVENSSVAVISFYAMLAFAMLNIFGSGPASASYAYISRCFTRGEHVWVWSDGVSKFKENFKSSMIMVILDFVLLFLVVNAVVFYSRVANGGAFLILIKYILILCFVLYMMAHIFIYQLMVTYDNKLRDVIKNAILLTLAKAPMCFVITLVTGAIFFVIFYFIPIFSIPVYILVGLTFTKFTLEFYGERVIEKNIGNNKNSERAYEE